ncbi:hypothetical protein ACFL1P_00455 [Patescibacteria group bacterium]
MEKKMIPSFINKITIYSILVVVFCLTNLLALYLVHNSRGAIFLLRQQVSQLEQDQQIISSSQQLIDTYEDEIDVISQVFPDEESMLLFIQSLEQEIKTSTDTYSVKFNSLTPLKEKDKLFLLMTLSLKTDILGLHSFLKKIETLPYMTHITSVSVKTPGGIFSRSDVSVNIKIYVRNPFTTK